MKRMVLACVMTGLVFGLWAEPLVSGGEGLARIVDARNQGLYSWTAGVSFAGDDHGAEHMFDWDIRTWDNSVFRVFGSWVPFESLELNAAWGLGYSYPQISEGAMPSFGLWDLGLGAKYTWPLEFWTVGLDARTFLPIRSSFFDPGVFGGSVRVLATRETEIFTTHLNLGGLLREKAGVFLGAGAELRYDFFNPYIELTSEVFADSFPVRLTPGVRILTDIGISLFYAADFGLTPDARSINLEGGEYVNQISLGLSYSPVPQIVRRKALLFVKVWDASTDEPVAAQVTIPNHYPGVFVIGPSGERVLDVQSGRYKVIVSAPGYTPQTYTLNFTPRRTSVLEIGLEPDRTVAHLIVKTADRQTGSAIHGASVAVAGVTLATDEVGEAHFSMPPGSYTIEAAAPGYLPKKEAVLVSASMPLAVTISMLKSDARIRISGIYFPSGSAVIPASSYPAIDDAVRVLEGNPDIHIEIQGHTDSEGSEEANLILSQRRAEAVRDYIIRVHGIPSSRLQARGYGESMPVASNDTEAGRARNRRVELVVLP